MDGWLWSNGKVILTGENWRIERKILYSITGRWTEKHQAGLEWYWHKKTEVLEQKNYTASEVDKWMYMEEWNLEENRSILRKAL
jgi:hypothetical protein